jgi:predicted dehydrogenase
MAGVLERRLSFSFQGDTMSIGIGIIGAGGISRAHAKGYAELGDRVRIVAVADIAVDKAQQAAADWGAEHSMQRYEDLLALPGVDAVSVCTHNCAHSAPAVAALEAGKHVLVEKPMAATTEEALMMVRASHSSGKLLMVEMKWRFMQEILAARDAVARGDLGRVYFAEAIGWQHRGIPGRNFIKKDVAGGGALMDNGVYTLDAILYMLGHPRPLTVSGTAADIFGSRGGGSWDATEFTVEDFASAFVRLEGGITLVFGHAWAINFDDQWQLRIAGDRGGLEIHPFGPEPKMRIRQGGYSDLVDMPVELPEGSTEIGYVVRQFVEAIEVGGPSPVPAETFLYTNIIFDGLYESSRQGGEVEVRVPEL